MCDNEYPLIVLEPSTQTAWLEAYIWGDGGRFEQLTKPVTFGDFWVSLDISEGFDSLIANLSNKPVLA
jgi:hypothetical protein